MYKLSLSEQFLILEPKFKTKDVLLHQRFKQIPLKIAIDLQLKVWIREGIKIKLRKEGKKKVNKMA